jgi:capsular exopolysaccharide synthesis family protein
MTNPKLNQADQLMEESLDKPLDLQEALYVIIEKAWVIAICFFVGALVGLAQIGRTPSTYRSVCVLQVDPEQRKVVSFQDENATDSTNSEGLQTALEGFHSRVFLKRVAKVIQLPNEPLFLAAKPNGQPYTLDECAGALGGMIDVSARKGTRLIDVAVEHQNPGIAQKLADSFSHEFIKQSIEQRAASAQIAVEFLMDEANKLKAKLQQSEQAMQAYKEKYNSVSLVDKQDIVITKMQALNGQLSAAKAERLRLETDYNEVKQKTTRTSSDPGSYATQAEILLEIPSVANHPVIVDIKKQIATAEQNISALSLRYKDKHPRMIQARNQLAESKAALVENVFKMPALLRAAYENAVANEKNFEQALQAQEKLALNLNQQAIPYNVLARDVETDRAVYESILKSLKETDIAKEIVSGNYRIFESATLPGSPTGPKKVRIMAISMMAGLLSGLALSFGLYMLDSSFRTVDQTEAITGLPVVGMIPRWPRASQSRSALAILDDPDALVAESFRSLRAALAVSGRESLLKVCLFTSALPEEGKTFCATNYAVALAQQQLRTVIIDADLRREMVAQVLLPESPSVGLASYLAGKADIEDITYPTEIPTLHVIPAGEGAPNPAELLSGNGFGRLIKELSGSFDRIVIDSAPINAVSDTLLVLQHCKSICLVARMGKTPRKVLSRASDLLARSGSRNVYIVMNQMIPRPSFGGYYHYFSTQYNYGKSYSPSDSVNS